MKKILISILSLILIWGCTKDITSVNKNPKAPEVVLANSLFSNAQKELFDYMASPNVNVNTFRLWSQHWTQTTYVDESNYELLERNINGEVFDRLYARILRDLAEARVIMDADEFLSDADKANQLAMITVLEVYSYHVLVDIFGDVPYSEALDGNNNVTPVFDDAAGIYKDLFTKLDGAITALGAGSAGNLADGDFIYGGDAASWQTFASSLKLKLALRMADIDPAMAQSAGSAALANVISRDGQSARFSYQNSTPNTNPLWEDLVQSGRTDFVVANTLADVMNSSEDPRRGVYFRELDSLGALIGLAHGAGGSYYTHSQPGDALENKTLPGVLMDYTEVLFLQSEAAARGWGGDASALYQAAVNQSVTDWTGTAATAAFLNKVHYDSLMAAPNNKTWKEVIATQKWVALYNRGFEAWSTWRLYDAPTMNVSAEAGTTPPTRYNYSVDEYSINGTSVSAANSGSDLVTDKVFWDVN
jgi:hypothetical protein|tara:strand:- start:1446 stop:2873 length:1428 start_codon:yes stop_codon:yes gene_type:complete